MSWRRNDLFFNDWPRHGRLALGIGINLLGLALLVGHGFGAG